MPAVVTRHGASAGRVLLLVLVGLDWNGLDWTGPAVTFWECDWIALALPQDIGRTGEGRTTEGRKE